MSETQLDELLKKLEQCRNGLERAAVYSELGELMDRRAVPVLIRGLDDPHHVARADAATALGKIGDPQAVARLIKALRDKSHMVRRDAAYALGEIGDKSAVRSLIRVLRRDKSGEVRKAAATALGELRDDKAVTPLLDALKDEDSYARGAAAYALRHFADPRIVPALIETFSSASLNATSTERAHVVAALNALKDPHAIPILVRGTEDESHFVRERALEGLRIFLLLHPDGFLELPPEDLHRLENTLRAMDFRRIINAVCRGTP